MSLRFPAEQLQSTEPGWDQPSQPSVCVTGQPWFPALPPSAPATDIGFPACCGLGLPALSAVPADSEAAPGAEPLNGAEPLLPQPLPQCHPPVPCLSAAHRARVPPSCGSPEHKGDTEQHSPNQLLYQQSLQGMRLEQPFSSSPGGLGPRIASGAAAPAQQKPPQLPGSEPAGATFSRARLRCHQPAWTAPALPPGLLQKELADRILHMGHSKGFCSAQRPRAAAAPAGAQGWREGQQPQAPEQERLPWTQTQHLETGSESPA